MTLHAASDSASWEWRAASARAIFTTSASGNIAQHVGDDPDAVQANRTTVAERLGLTLDDVAGVSQVHGADVWLDLQLGDSLPEEVRWAHAGVPLVEADALVSARPGIALAVAVADCVPIALAYGDAVAVVHAGWRSLDAGIVEAAMATLRRAAGSSIALADAGPFAVIGPCLGPCCMEVGTEVAHRFPDTSIVRHAGAPRPFLDARADARRRLEDAGAQVDVVDVCTRCDERLFSYRGDGSDTGRQAVLVMRA